MTRFRIPEDGILVVLAELDLLRDPSPAEIAALGDEERARALRFHREADRRRYLRSHRVLRTVLGELVGEEPHRLRFESGIHGKPHLPDLPSIHFNLTHSGEWAGVAVTRGGRVGIDVERISPDRRSDDLVLRRFAAGERSSYASIPDETERVEAFFALWTRKEAFLKGTGEGIARGLDTFEVTAVGEARLLRADGIEGDGGWRLVDLPVAPGYRGAVAVEGRGGELLRLVHPKERG